MIETVCKIITVYCDDCDETYESYVEQEFFEFIREIEGLGWKTKRVRGEFEHHCPECSSPANDFPKD